METTRAIYAAGRVEDYMKQIGRTVVIEGKEQALFRTSGNEFFALENRNPHPKGGPLFNRLWASRNSPNFVPAV